MSTIKEKTNEELVQLYIDGSNKAFDELLARTQDQVFSYILYVVKDEDLANDLFQDTYVKAIVKMKKGAYMEIGRVESWLLRIAHNVIADYYRSDRLLPKTDLPDNNNLQLLKDGNMSDSCREDQMVRAQIRRDVVRLMDALPEDQRDVVYMKFFLDMPFKEIAQQTGVSINTSLGRMRYAMINMRRMTRRHQMNLWQD